MAKQIINLGTAPSGAGGDDRRSAWLKTKANFSELYNWISGLAQGDDVATALPTSLPVSKGGTGGNTPATGRAGLGLKNAAVADILGSVSQSSGIPTGAILERGSNANGEFIRLADGTQICWGITSMTHNGASLAPTSAGITFPAAFIGFVSTANPKISTQVTMAYPISNNSLQINRLSGCATSNSGMLIEGAWTPGQTCYIGWTATGRWY